MFKNSVLAFLLVVSVCVLFVSAFPADSPAVAAPVLVVDDLETAETAQRGRGFGHGGFGGGGYGHGGYGGGHHGGYGGYGGHRGGYGGYGGHHGGGYGGHRGGHFG